MSETPQEQPETAVEQLHTLANVLRPLIEWVHGIRAERDALRAEVESTGRHNLIAQITRLRAEVERLKARVAGEHFESQGWQKRTEKAEARVEAVLALHKPIEGHPIEHYDGRCICCSVQWPCPTRRALEGEP
jgi:hypothetical protein